MSTDDGTARPITDEELHALVDGRLPPAVAAELEVRVAADPQAQATLHAWRTQREELRRLHRQLLEEPVPRQQVVAALRIEERLRRRVQWWQLGGMAASVVLAFGAGWFAHSISPGSVQRQFARQAAVAHVAFLPEVR